MRTKKELPKEPMTFRLDAGLKPVLVDLAERKGLTISQLINLSVSYFLDKNGIQTDPNEKRMIEIVLLFETQRFKLIGYEKYVEELRTFAKELNLDVNVFAGEPVISEEDIFKDLTKVLEYVWKLPKSESV